MIRILGIAATAALVLLLAFGFTGDGSQLFSMLRNAANNSVTSLSSTATATVSDAATSSAPASFPTAPRQEAKQQGADATPQQVSSPTNTERAETTKQPPSTAAQQTTPAQAPMASETLAEGETPVTRPDIDYPYPPVSLDVVNTNAREALVNILCAPTSGALYPISASGVLIDSRGIILTNAHVGQYFLLEADSRVDMRCTIRNGSPARERWSADLMYLPESWVAEHARDLTEQRPMGTGEHDWALLRISESLSGSDLPDEFPHLDPETRQGALFEGDEVLLASYPAGFVGGITAYRNLYPGSAVATVGQLFTFTETPIDLVSLGGVVLAQGGSSGGVVANAWNTLVGIITTSSDAESTSERDLRAITLEHVNRSIQAHTGVTLKAFLESDPKKRADEFSENLGPRLSQALFDVITR